MTRVGVASLKVMSTMQYSISAAQRETFMVDGALYLPGWQCQRKRAIHLAPAYTTSSSQLFFVTMSRYVTGSVATACSSSR